MVTGSVAIGVTGGGIDASVSIALLTKDTEGFLGSFATVNALGNSASLAGIVDGDAYNGGSSFAHLASFHGVAVQASTSEAVTNFAAAGAGGLFVGLAGGIAVEVFHSTTLAFVGNNARIDVNSSRADAAQSVNVSATNRASDFSFAGGLGVGLAGIAGGLDVGLLQNSTQAYVMDGATLDARQDVSVFALADDNVKTYALAAGAGPWAWSAPCRSGRSARHMRRAIRTATPATGPSRPSPPASSRGRGRRPRRPRARPARRRR